MSNWVVSTSKCCKKRDYDGKTALNICPEHLRCSYNNGAISHGPRILHRVICVILHSPRILPSMNCAISHGHRILHEGNTSTLVS